MQTISNATIDDLCKQLGYKPAHIKQLKLKYAHEQKALQRLLEKRYKSAVRQAERNDRDNYLEALTVKAIDKHEKRRQTIWQQRQLEQEQLTQEQRLIAAANQLVTLRSPAAANMEPHSGSNKPESTPPPAVAEVDLSHHIGLITDAIRQVERLIAAEQGLITHPQQLTGADKDREILREWEGFSAAYVATVAPHLGSRRMIEKARQRHKVDPT